MNLLSVDPGPETCGLMILDVDSFPPPVVEQSADVPVADVLAIIVAGKWHGWAFSQVAAERVVSYRQGVGSETFETIEVYGRIWDRCETNGVPFTCISRKEVKARIGLQTSAKMPQVNEVVRLTYPRSGGGKKPQVGTKGKPGPLYGVKDHAWAALGVGLAWCLEREREQRAKELAALKAGA